MRRDDSLIDSVDHATAGEPDDLRLVSGAAGEVVEVPRRLKVFRPFYVVSFVAIVVTAILLAMCYRYVSVQSIKRQAEVSNMVVAQAAYATVHENLDAYLTGLDIDPGKPFPAELAAPLLELVRGTKLDKVKIYDRHGNVKFSTNSADIGRQQSDNPGVVKALSGETAAKLIYRDLFNSFNAVTPDDNLIQTYMPLQLKQAGPFIGVFEVYTDVSAMVSHNERNQTIIVSTLVVVLMLLYLALLGFVRRMERVIIAQEDTLHERAEQLAVLSARLLDRQEAEKQRIAGELHERVAQTLAAVKMTVESAVHAINRGDETSLTQLEGMIPILQTATQDVRSVAVGLRPPSLDDLGLMATLRWFSRDFAEKHPDIDLESRLEVDEAHIPTPLKAIIYRVAEDTCLALAANDEVTRITMSLDADSERVVLTVRDDALADHAVSKDHPYGSVRERTLLSGGKFLTMENAWGGLNMMATWRR